VDVALCNDDNDDMDEVDEGGNKESKAQVEDDVRTDGGFENQRDRG
jgi:hypothetical protein